MTRLRLLYEIPRDREVWARLEASISELTDGWTVDESVKTTTTRAIAWRLPNRRLARLLQRRLLEQFKACAHDVVSISCGTVR